MQFFSIRPLFKSGFFIFERGVKMDKKNTISCHPERSEGSRFFGGQAPLRMMKQTNCRCERSVPQATPTGGPVRDERSEHAISDGLPRAHTLAKTETSRSVFSSCHPCVGGDLPDCHSCQAQRERESMPRQARHDTFGQMGRSMVEMLGVLAIMGIVGMVGVKMYTSAMNKHKANELIYEAQKRATMVAMQITAGQENLSITNFTNPTGYTFGVKKENDKQFVLTLEGVAPDICIQMKTNDGGASPIRRISENCSEIFFNDDLSNIGEEKCVGAGKIWCASTGLCSDTGACCATKDCTASSCPDESSTSGQGGTTGVFVNGNECKCPEDTFYNGASCVSQPASCHDWTKNECGFGYYCDFTYNDNNLNPNLNHIKNTSEKECFHDLSGTCKKITPVFSTPTADNILILKNAGLKSTLVMGERMHWWSAFNWCLGQGKKLLDVTELKCYYQGNTLVKEGNYGGYCCKKGSLCNQSTWDTFWNGRTIVNKDEVEKYADTVVAIRKVYGVESFWTASTQLANGSPNSCYALLFYATRGDLYGNGGRSGTVRPLCE